MGKSEVIRKLKSLSDVFVAHKKEFWHSPDFLPGVAKGIVVELLGNARIEWLFKLFLANPEAYIFWCEHEQHINPTAIHQRGLALERIKFINSHGDLKQPLRLALESQHYPFVVAPNQFSDVKVFQRFHILAEKSKSTLFLLGDKTFSLAWPISLQLEINNLNGGFDIHVQRQKHELSQ